MPLRFLAAAILLFAINVADAANPDPDSLLRVLDSTIATKEQFSQARRDRIAASMHDLRNARNDNDLYNIYRTLYGLYRSFRGDSAMWVAERRLETARRIGDPGKIISATINLAESYSKAADYHRAIEMLDELDRKKMADYHLKYMYQVYTATYRRMAKSDGVMSRRLAYEDLVRAYRDSTIAMCDPAGDEYHYINATRLMGVGQWKTALNILRALEDKKAFTNDAGFITQMATVCHNLNDHPQEVRYLAEAATIDLRNGICDYVALMDLAAHLNEQGDSRRAYRYIRCALEDASVCNARSRTAEILEMIPLIDAAYHESEAAAASRLRIVLIITALLVIALAIALWLAGRQLRLNRRIRRELDHQNTRLSEANKSLLKANSAREKYITQLFDAHSGYISRMALFRKSISRLMKAGQYTKALDLASSDRTDSEELRELYARFDSVFMSLYPDFIPAYNSMVRDECRIDPAITALTSELRVIALMKIGINENARIAEMLHYTTQTVYNYKSAVYNSLKVPKDRFVRFLTENSPSASIPE